jgi:serine protease Do
MKMSKFKKRDMSIVWCITALLMAVFLFYFLQDQAASKALPEPTANPGSFARLVKTASPSVVNISAVRIIKPHEQVPFPFGSEDPLKEFFEKFFREQMPGEFREKSLGTGFIIDKGGHILTNNHVVEQTTEIKVKLANNREYLAKIIGRDPLTDLALIRIHPNQPLEPLAFGDSDRVEVGDWVLAIGNPYGLGNTVTAGIVSAKYRQIGAGAYDNFIQTDTPINPGNSGGPLLNTAGEVIGINTAIFTETGGSVGIGFAIPINMAKDLLPQLRKGRIVRGWLGVMIQKITPELKAKLNLVDEKGALVSDVVAGGPAERAGIRRGDVIVSFNDKTIETSGDLPYVVASTPVGNTVTVEVIRKGQKMRFQVETDELKEEAEVITLDESSSDLGMVLQQLNPQLAQKLDLPKKNGLLVIHVENNSPAAEAGLMPGDIILEVDQTSVVDLAEFNRRIKEFKAGDTVLFLVDRGGPTIYATLRIY